MIKTAEAGRDSEPSAITAHISTGYSLSLTDYN